MKISSFNRSIGKTINYTVQKTFAKALEKGQKEPAKYAAMMMVVSLVSKDLVNCIFYTAQSWNNKKIPEDKRKFVAAMDGVNGVINVLGQIGSFLLIERTLTPKMKAKWSGVLKDADDKVIGTNPNRPLANDNIVDIVKKSKDRLKDANKNIAADIENVDIDKISKQIIKKYGKGSPKVKAIETGVGLIITILATNALIKRTITPLFATPLAGWITHKYLEKGDKEVNPEEKEELMNHVKASWNYANKDGDKATFRKIISK